MCALSRCSIKTTSIGVGYLFLVLMCMVIGPTDIYARIISSNGRSESADDKFPIKNFVPAAGTKLILKETHARSFQKKVRTNNTTQAVQINSSLQVAEVIPHNVYDQNIMPSVLFEGIPYHIIKFVLGQDSALYSQQHYMIALASYNDQEILVVSPLIDDPANPKRNKLLVFPEFAESVLPALILKQFALFIPGDLFNASLSNIMSNYIIIGKVNTPDDPVDPGDPGEPVEPADPNDPLGGNIPADPNGPGLDAFQGVPYNNAPTILVEPTRWKKVVESIWYESAYPHVKAIQAAIPGDIIEMAPGEYNRFHIGSYDNGDKNAKTCGGEPSNPITIRATKDTNGNYQLVKIKGNSEGLSGDTILMSSNWCAQYGQMAGDVGLRHIQMIGLFVEGSGRSGMIFDQYPGTRQEGHTFVGMTIDGRYDHACGPMDASPTQEYFSAVCANGVGCGFDSKWGVISHWTDFSWYDSEVKNIKKEHGFYIHNPTSGVRLINNKIHHTGRTGIQMVSRANEGPWTDQPSYFVGNHIHDNNLDDGGAQVSFSQCGDIRFYDNRVEAITDPLLLAAGDTYSTQGGPTRGLVVWAEGDNEEKHPHPYWVPGIPVPDDHLVAPGNYSPVLPGPEAYGLQNCFRIELRGNTFLYEPTLKDSIWWNTVCPMDLGTDPLVTISDTREVVLEDNIIVGTDSEALLLDNGDPNAFNYQVSGCGNTLYSQTSNSPQGCNSHTSATGCPDVSQACD